MAITRQPNLDYNMVKDLKLLIENYEDLISMLTLTQNQDDAQRYLNIIKKFEPFIDSAILDSITDRLTLALEGKQ